ncbi:DUF930 domain-containing protein [Hoeflea marina]|nr:DUF930 domain-containing protein [Hoeflea marina]
MLSARVLADPRSRKALAALRRLGTDERIIQLCDLEAMEQVHAWKAEFEPDLVVAYATSDPTLKDRTLRADGGAVRSRKRWYGISFTCDVSADLEKVKAFEFAMGEEIPESEWEVNALASDDGPSD